MIRKPEHYPRWMRELLFDPIQRAATDFTNDPARNCKTLKQIWTSTYLTNMQDALLFDLAIEQERHIIDEQEKNEHLKKMLKSLEARVKALEEERNDFK